MKIFLLTHEREYARKTNTGSLAIEPSNGMVERILWSRTQPDQQLLQLINAEQALLIYTKGDGPSAALEDFENIIIIDATWQESQKIFNKSPYLKAAPQTLINTDRRSSYRLRLNQPDGGLCTFDCIIEILNVKGNNELAAQLEVEFERFNSGELAGA